MFIYRKKKLLRLSKLEKEEIASSEIAQMILAHIWK